MEKNRAVVLILFLQVYIFFFSTTHLKGQILLQLEINNEIEAVKFNIGDVLVIKTKSIDEWQKRKLEKLIIDQNLIVFEDGMVELEDIIKVKLHNNAAGAVGKLFSGFGAGWMLFGGIAHFTTKNKFTWETLAIGAVSLGIGWLFNKIVSQRTFRIGKNAHLRIIDISFPEPEKQTIIKQTIP